MEVKLLKRKSWADEGGVSEIIGNILILMITVVLFSGIMMFVNEMPVPEQTVKADFAASVSFDNLGSTATLTVTHIGGATMDSPYTVVLVSIDETTQVYRLSEDPDFPYDEWVMGTEWVKTYNGTTYASSISVTIIDDESHNAVWVSQVTGGMGGTPPTILQRYVDSDTDTLTVDPVKEYDDFTLFVKISDLDKDLRSVWLDSSSIEGGSPNDAFDSPSSGIVPSDGGWFEWDFNDVANDSAAIDGKTLIIYAEDAAGHRTSIGYELSVIVLPTDIDYYPADTTPQEGGMPSYITNINDGQGFAVFGENGTSGTANVSDPRTVFARGENVFIRVASFYVLNLGGANDLTLIDARTDIDYTYLAVFQSPSTYTDPFYNYAYGGNIAVYQAAFNTSGLIPGTYTMNMLLKATGSTNYMFDSEETLYIYDDDSPITYFPKVWTYQDDGYTTDWGYTKTTPFDATGPNCKMYIAIYVQDAQDDPEPSLGEIRITDMVGGTQLYGPPNSGTMISAVTDSATNNTAYVFWIDLRFNNGDNWKTGTNSYTLEISQFSDENEGVYAYSRQVFVKSSFSRSDFFMGTSGIYSSKGGSTNFIAPEYIYYVENNNFFTTRLLHTDENAPSTAPLFYHNAMALGDFDNDGDMDLLAGSNMDKTGSSYSDLGKLLYFENTMNTYGVWQAPSIITRPDATTTKIEWIASGDINGDGDTDFAYSTSGHQVVIFNNTYGTQGTIFMTYGSTYDGIRKIALEDMTGDGRADLIVLAEGKVRMYDLTKWTSGLFATMPNPVTITSNIEDFDIADMNNDGMLDIITVDPTAGTGTHDLIEGVWVNNYTANEEAEENLVVDVEQYAGSNLVGTMVLTEAVDDDPMRIEENVTGDEEDQGQVDFVFEIETPLTEYSDPQLVVRAKIGPSDAQEVFYVWYSTGSDPETAVYTPVMVITAKEYTDYTFNLPSSVAGATSFFVKITDSSTAPGLKDEYLDIDYLAVKSNRFGSYWPTTMPAVPNRYQVTGVNTSAEIYYTARAINFDGDVEGDDRLEVVVAKNGKFVVYDHRTPITDPTEDKWMVHNETNMYIYPGGLSTYVAISPTLFEVDDINGDGYDDILTAWVTVGAAAEVSLLKAYLNVDPETYWEVDIKDVFAGMLAGTETGCLVKIAAVDIYDRG